MSYEIKSTIIKGDRYGRKLGFPTVNLKKLVKDMPSGIYTGKASFGNKKYRAAIVINEAGRVDAHLLGYRGDAYGKEIILQINEFIRKFKTFDSEKELIAQIKQDIKNI